MPNKETRPMIELYTWPTPNGHKVHIMLEETGLPYNVHPIDISAGDQFDPEFLKISPNNRMPAIVDPDGPDGKPISLFESGAILIYLAEKTGRFLPEAPRARYATLQWLMWQMGGLGPMLGQAHHFRQYAPEKIPYAVDRYTNEAHRLYGVADRRLGETRFLAGDEYTIQRQALVRRDRRTPGGRARRQGPGRAPLDRRHGREGPRHPVRRDPVPAALAGRQGLAFGRHVA
jgi:glutathione S-transferase